MNDDEYVFLFHVAGASTAMTEANWSSAKEAFDQGELRDDPSPREISPAFCKAPQLDDLPNAYSGPYVAVRKTSDRKGVCLGDLHVFRMSQAGYSHGSNIGLGVWIVGQQHEPGWQNWMPVVGRNWCCVIGYEGRTVVCHSLKSAIRDIKKLTCFASPDGMVGCLDVLIWPGSEQPA